MSGTFIFLIVIVVTYFLGKYALSEGRRIEEHKEFIKNLNNHKKK